MLTELSVVEQRYLAVREVLEGVTVTGVATRYGVDRRSVHRWLLRYANEGLGALADRKAAHTGPALRRKPTVQSCQGGEPGADSPGVVGPRPGRAKNFAVT